MKLLAIELVKSFAIVLDLKSSLSLAEQHKIKSHYLCDVGFD